jgi:tRNA(Ile)-lysidine synthase
VKTLISSLLETLQTCPSSQRIWIAYSGGLDSHLLLHTLAQLRSQLKSELHAIHIHHHLHPEADNWAKHCQQVCETLKIPCEIRHIQVKIAPRESLEANARTARYAAISQLLEFDDLVLTAQHADDQAETVLLQLFRGAGVAGLAAMPLISRLGLGWLVRPLLNYSRAQLHEYACQANLDWIEDPSNAETRFERNFLRHRIMPLLQQRWPSVNQVLTRVAHHQAEADELIQTLAKQDWQTCKELAGPNQLFLPMLLRLNPARQRNVLRFWLKQLKLPLPSTSQLQHILTDILTAKPDRQPLVQWQGAEVRRYHHHLFAMPNLPLPPKCLDSLNWTFPHPLSLPLGELVVTESQEGGLVLPSGTTLQVHFRQGGETFYWHGHHRKVKKLLQAEHLLPWERPFIPLIYIKDTLIAIPEIGIRDGFVTTEKKGWNLQWLRHF